MPIFLKRRFQKFQISKSSHSRGTHRNAYKFRFWKHLFDLFPRVLNICILFSLGNYIFDLRILSHNSHKNIKYIISYSQEWIMLRVWSEKILRIFSYKIWLTWNAEIFIIWENNPVNHYCGRCLCVHSFNISGTLVHVMCEVLARQGKTLCMCYDELIVIEP